MPFSRILYVKLITEWIECADSWIERHLRGGAANKGFASRIPIFLGIYRGGLWYDSPASQRWDCWRLNSGVSTTYFNAHCLGDEVFLESLSQKCKGYRWVANKNITSLQSQLNALRQLVSEWKKVKNTLHLGSCGWCIQLMTCSWTEWPFLPSFPAPEFTK